MNHYDWRNNEDRSYGDYQDEANQEWDFETEKSESQKQDKTECPQYIACEHKLQCHFPECSCK